MTEVSGIAKEIEHKFLLSSLPDKLNCDEDVFFYYISHGWLPGNVIKERITFNSRGQGEYWRTIKSGTGLERIEAQERIDPDFYSKLWPMTEGRRISKFRYCVRDEEFLWEIDVFNDRELLLAEVEVSSVFTEIELPKWLKDSVVREVTYEPQYLNENLAK